MIDRRSSIPRRQQGDRRQNPRIPSKARLRFLRAGTTSEEILHGELLDVSASGIRIMLDEQLAFSDKLLLEILDANDHCYNLTAQVVWLEPTEDDRFRTGCELCLELTRKQQAMLRRFIRPED